MDQDPDLEKGTQPVKEHEAPSPVVQEKYVCMPTLDRIVPKGDLFEGDGQGETPVVSEQNPQFLVKTVQVVGEQSSQQKVGQHKSSNAEGSSGQQSSILPNLMTMRKNVPNESLVVGIPATLPDNGGLGVSSNSN